MILWHLTKYPDFSTMGTTKEFLLKEVALEDNITQLIETITDKKLEMITNLQRIEASHTRVILKREINSTRLLTKLKIRMHHVQMIIKN
jgi:hypothetical protein